MSVLSDCTRKRYGGKHPHPRSPPPKLPQLLTGLQPGDEALLKLPCGHCHGSGLRQHRYWRPVCIRDEYVDPAIAPVRIFPKEGLYSSAAEVHPGRSARWAWRVGGAERHRFVETIG